MVVRWHPANSIPTKCPPIKSLRIRYRYNLISLADQGISYKCQYIQKGLPLKVTNKVNSLKPGHQGNPNKAGAGLKPCCALCQGHHWVPNVQHSQLDHCIMFSIKEMILATAKDTSMALASAIVVLSLFLSSDERMKAMTLPSDQGKHHTNTKRMKFNTAMVKIRWIFLSFALNDWQDYGRNSLHSHLSIGLFLLAAYELRPFTLKVVHRL